MKRIYRWFGGYIHLGLKGRQINRFMNLCSKNGIRLWNITQDIEHFVRVHLRLHDFYYLKPYLRKTKTKLRILGRYGFPFWCYRHPRLKWFPVLAICAIGGFLYSTTYIWQIHIDGNIQLSEQELRYFLAEQAIEEGTKRNSIDCAQLEYTIRQNFQELGWVSVHLDKTHLYIDVRESLYDQHSESVLDDKRYDLVANKDAYIYSMVTRSGIAAISEGMYVKQGDILVEGRCEIYDDYGTIKQELQLQAEADIWGDVEYLYACPLTELEIMALKIADLYEPETLNRIGQQKINYFLEKLEKNGVIILDKNVMIERDEKSILFLGKIYAREKIGINIPVEEIREDEFE